MDILCFFGGNLPPVARIFSICQFPAAATGMILIKLLMGLLEFDATFRKLPLTWELDLRNKIPD